MWYKVLMSINGRDPDFGLIVWAKTHGQAMGIAKEKGMGCRPLSVKEAKDRYGKRTG